MLFDPRTSAKPSHSIAVEQRRPGERFFHAENVTGFYAPSNLEKSLVIRRFFHIRPRIHPQNSAMSRFKEMDICPSKAGGNERMPRRFVTPEPEFVS